MNQHLLATVALVSCLFGCSERRPLSQSTPGDPSATKESGEAAQPEIAMPGRDRTEPAHRLAELDNVFETLFRHQFKSNESAAQQTAAAYFLTIKGEDPSDSFLKRFDGHIPPVKKGSRFETGEGLRLRIDNWEWQSTDKIVLTGGYDECNLSASGHRYVLVRENGTWAISDDQMEWLS